MDKDLISRQQAIKEVKELFSMGDCYCDEYAIVGMLNTMPSIQPERKVGKWIKDKSWSEGAGMGESYGYYWKCNQCNNIVKGDWSQCGDNFCSKCGADMRGEQDE